MWLASPYYLDLMNPKLCFSCGVGHYHEITEDYRIDLPGGDMLIVPQVLVLRCDKCGDDSIPPDSSRRIEWAYNERIKPT